MANDNVKLSKNLLRMKFMQRGMDAETKKQLEEDEKRIISDEHWYLDLPELKAKENLIIEEKSLVPCEDLRFGRISFKGFNPEVEKLMVLMNPKEETETENEEDLSRMKTDVTDEEMALRYESLVSSMKKKFAKKRERVTIREDVNQNVTKSKKAFLKPQDWTENMDFLCKKNVFFLFFLRLNVQSEWILYILLKKSLAEKLYFVMSDVDAIKSTWHGIIVSFYEGLWRL